MLPGLRAIQTFFTRLAFAPDKTKHSVELFQLGGADYMSLRATEMLSVYRTSGNAADLDMAIQLLATVRLLKHGPIETTKPPAA